VKRERSETVALEGVSAETMALHRECLVLDLHIDTLLWARLLGYDIATAFRPRPSGITWTCPARPTVVSTARSWAW